MSITGKLAATFRQVLAEHENGALGGIDLAEALAQAAAGITTQKPLARVVTRGLETDCAAGICPGACTHLMWQCERCSCEGGWGAPRDVLEQWAADHSCPPPVQLDEAKLASMLQEHRPTQWRSFANDTIVYRCCGQDFGRLAGRPLKFDRDPRELWEAHMASKLAGLLRGGGQ